MSDSTPFSRDQALQSSYEVSNLSSLVTDLQEYVTEQLDGNTSSVGFAIIGFPS